MPDEDWAVVSEALIEIEVLLRVEGDQGADELADLRRNGDRNPAAALTMLGSPRMWGHMGSFFDRALADRERNRELHRRLVRLADALEDAGMATGDLRSHASILREWVSRGV